MTEPTILRQQQREHQDPHEETHPVPWYVLILTCALFLFGLSYISYAQIDSAAEWGDGRSIEELSAGGKNAAADGKVDGSAIYASRCIACHQANGSGLPGVFPPLAGSEWVLQRDKALTAAVLHGVGGALTVKGQKYSGAMPAFKAQLSDAEIAAVLTHIRSTWGNAATPIDAGYVAKVRQETAGVTAPFNGDADLAAMTQ